MLIIAGIISRASAARGGLFDALNSAANNSEMDRDSISNSEVGRPTPTTAWNISPRHQVTGSSSVENVAGALQRSNKKLSWSNGGPGPGSAVLAKVRFLFLIITLLKHTFVSSMTSLGLPINWARRKTT